LHLEHIVSAHASAHAHTHTHTSNVPHHLHPLLHYFLNTSLTDVEVTALAAVSEHMSISFAHATPGVPVSSRHIFHGVTTLMARVPDLLLGFFLFNFLLIIVRAYVYIHIEIRINVEADAIYFLGTSLTEVVITA